MLGKFYKLSLRQHWIGWIEFLIHQVHIITRKPDKQNWWLQLLVFMLINLVFKKCNFFLVEASFARAFADVPTVAFHSKTLELCSLERMKYIVKPEIFVSCMFASPSEWVKLRLSGSQFHLNRSTLLLHLVWISIKP
jgi:hypothetical protein